MAIFKYKVVDKDKRSIHGLVEAASDDEAAEILQEKGWLVLSIGKESNIAASKYLSVLNRIKSKDLVLFSRQFAIMISANVTVVQALKILIDQTENLKMKMIISEIAFEVDSGSKLSDALAKRPKVFSNFFTNVIKSGETSGRLDESLIYLADEMEKDYDMTAKIRGALIYPAFVITGLVVVGTIMMIYVVPKLTDILTESGATLPLATRILVFISNFLTNFWWLLLLLAVMATAAIKFFTRMDYGKMIFDSLILKLPIFGKLFQRIYLVRFTRSLHTLIVGGVALTDGLKTTAEVVNNQVYKKLIKETVKAVEEGNSISSIFVNSKEVPAMVSQMMSIGEKTGKLDLVLENVSNFYSREVSNITANLMTLMEPLVMVIVGVGVGIMVAAIILPMYNLASNI